MKNLSKITLIFGLLLLTLIACKKEPEVDPDNNQEEDMVNADGQAVKDFIQAQRVADAQTFVVDMSTFPQEITGEQGTKVKIYGSSFIDANGNFVSGNVDVKIIEIYSKADMLLMNKTTMGLLPDGNHAMLVSGGEIYIEASQNGQALEMNSGVTVEFPVDNTGGADTEMKLFVDEGEDNDCDGLICEDDVWVEVEEDTVTGNNGGGVEILMNSLGQTIYSAVVGNFGWTNVDRFYSYTGPKTTLKVQAPDGFDASNLAIYLSYDGEPNALAALDTYIESEEVFSEHYGQIPIGQSIHVIAISVVDDQYSAVIQAATIVEDAVIVLEDLEPTSAAALTTEIENLP